MCEEVGGGGACPAQAVIWHSQAIWRRYDMVEGGCAREWLFLKKLDLWGISEAHWKSKKNALWKGKMLQVSIYNTWCSGLLLETA